MCLYWLKNYDTESALLVEYDLDEKDVRLWLWYYAECLEVLSGVKIVLPQRFDDNIPFPLAVDGTHSEMSPCMTCILWIGHTFPTNTTQLPTIIR